MNPVGTWIMRPIRRWTDRRKQELLGAIAAGLIGEGRARLLHSISEEELNLWRFQFDDDGGFVGRCFGRDGNDRAYR